MKSFSKIALSMGQLFSENIVKSGTIESEIQQRHGFNSQLLPVAYAM